jgi:hypothetical protein
MRWTSLSKKIRYIYYMIEFYTLCLILALLCALSVINTYINGLYFDNFTFWSVLQTIYGLAIAGATCYVVYKGWQMSGGLGSSSSAPRASSMPSAQSSYSTAPSTASYAPARPSPPMGRRY